MPMRSPGKWITTQMVVMIFWSMDYFIVLCCCCLQFFCAVRSRGLCLIFALDFAFVHTLQLTGLAEMLFGRVKLLIIRFSSFLVVFFYYYFVFFLFIFGCFGSRLLFSIFLICCVLLEFFLIFSLIIFGYSCHFFTYISYLIIVFKFFSVTFNWWKCQLDENIHCITLALCGQREHLFSLSLKRSKTQFFSFFVLLFYSIALALVDTNSESKRYKFSISALLDRSIT